MGVFVLQLRGPLSLGQTPLRHYKRALLTSPGPAQHHQSRGLAACGEELYLSPPSSPPVGQLVEWGADVAQEGAGLTSISHGFQLIPTFWDSYKRLRCSRNISEYLWALSSASLLPLSPSSEIKEALFASSPTIT